MRASGIVLGVLLTGTGWVDGQGLADLPILRDFQAHRITSVDPAGGNDDWRDLQPGQTLVLLEVPGAQEVGRFRGGIVLVPLLGYGARSKALVSCSIWSRVGWGARMITRPVRSS